MKTYIRKDIKGLYIEFPQELDNEVWEDKIGTTYQDFLEGKWVLLSEEQVNFHKENPQASINEVLNMELDEHLELERTLEIAQIEAIQKLNAYDNSDAVNGFTINGTIKAWFTVQERTNYKNSLDSAKLLGVDTLQFFVGDQALTIDTSMAERLLAMIQIYADACFIQTKKHENAIKALETIEEVDNYDFTTGYPNKLEFNI